MIFECNSSVITKACTTVSRTVSAKSSMVALEGIYIKATEGKIILSGYDTQVGSIITIDANVSEEGTALLNAKTLCDITRVLPDENVNFAPGNKNTIKISSGSTKYNLIGMEPNDYPELPVVESNNPVMINCATLKDMIRRVIFSVSTSERNPVHCGVKFEIKENELTVVAVDGSRLSIRRCAINYTGSPLSFVVPTKALGEVLKVNEENDEDIIIALSDRHISFSIDNYTIISRLLEGNFIDYNNAIPKEYLTSVKIGVGDLAECIERTSPVINDKISPVKLEIGGGVMRFSCVTSIGTADDTIAADIEGNDLTLGFNSRFMLDALRAIDSEEISINFGTATQPIVFIPNEGNDFLYLVLPARI